LKLAAWKTALGSIALAAALYHLAPYRGPVAQIAAEAQNFGQRTIAGRILVAEEQPVKGATVFLRNLKTRAIRTYTTDEKGHFRFAQISMAEDQEVWAELNGQKTPVKTVSTWDTRKQVDLELTLK
jgi:hypothetical protein